MAGMNYSIELTDFNTKIRQLFVGTIWFLDFYVHLTKRFQQDDQVIIGRNDLLYGILDPLTDSFQCKDQVIDGRNEMLCGVLRSFDV